MKKTELERKRIDLEYRIEEMEKELSKMDRELESVNRGIEELEKEEERQEFLPKVTKYMTDKLNMVMNPNLGLKLVTQEYTDIEDKDRWDFTVWIEDKNGCVVGFSNFDWKDDEHFWDEILDTMITEEVIPNLIHED